MREAGIAAAAAFLARSSQLTEDPGQRARRALAAAEATQQAGGLDEALALLDGAEAGPLEQLEQAHAEVLRARIAFATDRGRDAPGLLLAAARRLEALDARLARELYLDALTAAVFAGRLAGAFDARAVAVAARAAPPPALPASAAERLLEGLAVLIADGPAHGTPILIKALRAFAGNDIDPAEALRWRWLAGRAAGFVWDYEGWDSLTRQQVRAARDLGALAELPLALSTRVGVHLFAGETVEAATLIEEWTRWQTQPICALCRRTVRSRWRRFAAASMCSSGLCGRVPRASSLAARAWASR